MRLKGRSEAYCECFAIIEYDPDSGNAILITFLTHYNRNSFRVPFELSELLDFNFIQNTLIIFSEL